MAKTIQKPPILDILGDRVKYSPQRVKYSHLDHDDKLLILWGLSRGWTIRRTAETLPTSQSTVKNYRSRVFEDPATVFELSILKLTGSKSHQCGLCGETRPTLMKARRHVLSHVLPYEIARDTPLDACLKPL